MWPCFHMYSIRDFRRYLAVHSSLSGLLRKTLLHIRSLDQLCEKFWFIYTKSLEKFTKMFGTHRSTKSGINFIHYRSFVLFQ